MSILRSTPRKSVSKGRFSTFVTTDPVLVRAAQKLRYQVFAEKMGATLHSEIEGLDWKLIGTAIICWSLIMPRAESLAIQDY